MGIAVACLSLLADPALAATTGHGDGAGVYQYNSTPAGMSCARYSDNTTTGQKAMTYTGEFAATVDVNNSPYAGPVTVTYQNSTTAWKADPNGLYNNTAGPGGCTAANALASVTLGTITMTGPTTLAGAPVLTCTWSSGSYARSGSTITVTATNGTCFHNTVAGTVTDTPVSLTINSQTGTCVRKTNDANFPFTPPTECVSAGESFDLT